MDKVEKIANLKNNKTRKAVFLLNDELWEMFKSTCESNNTKPTWEVEKWMLTYLDKNGRLAQGVENEKT